MKFLLVSIFLVNISFGQSQMKDQLEKFSEYLTKFDYSERKEMKVNLDELIKLIKEGKVEIIDIRFKEEVETWNINFIKSIPLNELPNRLNELNKDKIIVTTCPHYDRAAIARHYLTLQGFKSKYLVEGLLGFTEFLRGDNAKNILEIINSKKEIQK